MIQLRNHPLLLLLGVLALVALACNGATSPDPAPDNAAVVNEAVATIQAGLPAAPAPVAPSTSNSVLIDLSLEETLVNLYASANPAVVHVFTRLGNLSVNEGSGFMIDEAGHIVTNNHVVENGDNYEVVFGNGERRRASAVGSDVDSDLAVIRVEGIPDGVRPLPLGDSSNLLVGQLVIAIGNPFGEEGSMSLGIVSGLGRSLTSQRTAEGGGRYSLPQVIQTDTAINPGNSGGPLLNLAGEVVGVNSAIRTTTGANSGVGFAIPVNAVRRVAASLIRDGRYIYPFIGIGALSEPLSLSQQEELGLSQANGAYVTSVTAGSAAAAAGLIPADPNGRGGDLIIAINGRQVREFTDLTGYLIFETEVGETVDLTILRDGEVIVVPVTLGARP